MTPPAAPPDAPPNPPGRPDPKHALSFAAVADDYERGRPPYPREAAEWLAGSEPRRILELGAGTGKLTAELLALGHEVVATDPLAEMLRHLAAQHAGARVALATAEHIPLPSRSVDVVACGQAFHWFDLSRALSEIARVLRPGGRIALAWNERDERVPWVRRLGDLIGRPEQDTDPTHTLLSSHLFGFVDSARFRFWQPLDRERLRAMVTSRSYVAVLAEPERAELLTRVDELYDRYGRGHDGMLLPYTTSCFAATVRPPAVADTGPGSDGPQDPPTEDDNGSLLIDFS
jgi:SAM-dependent methyltransferase